MPLGNIVQRAERRYEKMLNNDKQKTVAILVLGAIAIATIVSNTLMKVNDNTVVIALVGFLGGILVSKA